MYFKKRKYIWIKVEGHSHAKFPIHLFPNSFPQAYFAEQRPLYDFGVFLCSTVAMTQFPIFSISPAEHLKEIFKKKNVPFIIGKWRI